MSALLGCLLLSLAGPGAGAIQEANQEAAPDPASTQAPAQEPGSLVESIEQAPPAVEAVADRQTRSLATLGALLDSRRSKLDELRQLREEYDPETDSELRLAQLERFRELQDEVGTLERDFESIVTGIDLGLLELERDQDVDLVGQLTQFLQPLLSELREVTEEPREIERLSDELERLDSHEIPLVRSAVAHVEGLIAALEEEGPLAQELRASLERWRTRGRELDNRRQVVEFQLEQRLQSRGSLFDSTSSALGRFFRTRGLNLLAAAAAFFGILLLLRLVHRLARSLFRSRPRRERPFYARLIDVLYFAMSGVAAVCGALLVLYAVGDWPLLGLALLGLLGLAWASKTAVPAFFDQIRLLLNLGPVRELERVVVRGLPWRVERISLHTLLVNPELSGGRLRLPLQDLLDLRSRPALADEPWFPTSEGDWVLLDDGRHAQVRFQSPETVRLVYQGGSLADVPAADFHGRDFENLSRGFRVSLRFGIDYEHQGIATTRVPEVCRRDLEAALAERAGPEGLERVLVEFLEAGASSLDYAILADFAGSAAPRYASLRRLAQSTLVDTCTREGWVIPFAQLTVHGGVALQPAES